VSRWEGSEAVRRPASGLIADGLVEVPEMLRAHASGELVAVWRNDFGRLIFRDGERYLKWNPRDGSLDLDDERARLIWARRWHPVPEVIAMERDDSGLACHIDLGWMVLADRWADLAVATMSMQWNYDPTGGAF
jgi:aminoglycoside phosphotransferase